MKKIILLILILISATSVFAATCTDTDNGGADEKDEALKTLGEVKYGITALKDQCVTSTETDEAVSTNKSKYLREYFCQGGQRSNEIYDCTKWGYTGCENGACVGKANTTSSSGSSSSGSTTQNSCGNKILEKAKGEQCDPPGSICFGKTTAQYGSCQANCQCKISQAVLDANPVPVVCGDGERATGEDCEADKDCPTNYVCSSCKCVKKLTAAEIEAMKNQASGGSIEKEDETKSTTETPKTTLPGVDTEPKNFSDTPAMKATGGIASFFKSVFGWIASLFS